MAELYHYKDIHKNETMFIIGSGASLNHYPILYNLKYLNSIGVNHTIDFVYSKYLICHHHEVGQKLIDKARECGMRGEIKPHVFISEYDCGITTKGKHTFQGDYITYKHNEQSFLQLDTNIIDNPKDDKLLIGGTTVLNAIGLAYYMGCKNIILIGCDAGSIEGKVNLKCYGVHEHQNTQKQQYHSVETAKLIKQARDYFATKGVQILMLSPFLDYRLEGKAYKYNS